MYLKKLTKVKSGLEELPFNDKAFLLKLISLRGIWVGDLKTVAVGTTGSGIVIGSAAGASVIERTP